MTSYSSPHHIQLKLQGRKHSRRLTLLSAMLLAFGGSSLVFPIPESWAMPISVEDAPAGGISFGSTTHRCNNFLNRSFTVNDDFIVGDISLGLNISHGFRGAIAGILRAPNGSSTQFLGINGGDTNDNYDVLFEEGGGAINDGNNDDVSAPLYDRSVNPSSALSALAGNSSQGTWTLSLCDGGSGLTGTYNRSLLTLSPTDISGSVFDDVNRDTIQDVSEVTLANITVNAYQDDGDGIFEPGTGDVLIDSRQTQTNGDYVFGGLANGSYWIEVDETDPDLAGRTYGGSTATGTANPRFVTFSGTVIEDIDFPFIQDLQNLCEVGDPDGQLAFLSDVTLESGVDLQIGAVYRFANVFENVDALVEVSAFNGGATLGAIDNDTSGVAAAFQPTLNAVLNTTSSVDFDITFVARGTTAPVAMTFRAAGVDIDGNGQQLREFIELTNLTSFSLSPDTTLVDSVVSSGNRFESNTTNAQPGVSATATSTLVSTEYISVSQLRYRIGAIDAGSTGANQRLNSLFFGCTDGPDTPVTFDYGDAPDTYGTDEADSSGEGTGARHFIVNGIHLGTAPDAETDGQPSADATGDDADEDGVQLNSASLQGQSLTAGNTVTLDIATTGSGVLNAWIDWNGDGVFDDATESIANNADVSGGTLSVTVPATATVGTTYARFRFSSDTDLGPTGSASNGEVEDYQVAIVDANAFACPQAFFQIIDRQLSQLNPITGIYEPVGDPVVGRYNAAGYNPVDNFIYGIGRDAPILVDLVRISNDGSLEDLGPLTQTNAIGSGLTNAANQGVFDDSGNLWARNANSGTEIYQIDVNTREYIGFALSQNPGNVADWVFINNRLYGARSNTLYIIDLSNTTPGTTLPVTTMTVTDLPNGSYGAGYADVLDNLYLSNNGGSLYQILNYDTATPTAIRLVTTQGTNQNDGMACPNALPPFDFDFGDAPDIGTGTGSGNYETLLSDNGPFHLLDGTTFLGSGVSADTDGFGDGVDDNNDATDDNNDDGVQLGGSSFQGQSLVPGANITLDITTAGTGVLNAWIDWNGNGEFEAGEQIASDTDVSGGTLNVAVPASASAGNTYARFRYSSDTGLSPTGNASNGEVQDYQVAIATASDPNVLLVKRITRINGQTVNGSTNLDVYVDDAAFPYDDNLLDTPAPDPIDTQNWPNTTGNSSSTFLIGAIDGGEIKPGDEVEYTIYFLSTGTAGAVDVKLCDRIPDFQTYVPDAFNAESPAPSGGVGASRGILVEYNNTVLAHTNDDDGDTAQFFPPGSTLPDACSGSPAQSEDNGAIVVDLGDLPQATGPGNPTTSFGAVRFRTTVK